MASTTIAADFADHCTRNWCESNISKPTSIIVMNFNRDRQIQGYKNSALIIHRGQLQFMPIDKDKETRVWGTDIMLHGDTGADCEDYIIEFQRMLNSWEDGQGGAFTTGGIALHNYEGGVFDILSERTAVGSTTFYSKQTTRNIT